MYNSFLSNLNNSQLEAVLHGTGPMLVSAGPGSGKTAVIVARLLELILNKKVPPEKILVITFTRKAALSMRSRFYQAIQKEKFNSYTKEQVFFGTFHSFFYQILRSSTKYSRYQIIDSNKKNKTISQIVSKRYPKDYSLDLVHKIETAIGYFKNTLDVEKAKKHLSIEFQSAFPQVLNEYEAYLDENEQMDYDDLQFLCLRLLQNEVNTLRYWRNRFEYILMDEFQDCNYISFEIIKLLGKQPFNLFAVGDDDQAIYGFRGADMEVMPRFLKTFPGAKQVTLNINYRSMESIVNKSLKVISENQNRLGKIVNARKENEEERVILKGFINERDMYEYVCCQLKNLEPNKLESHAILFRTNSGISYMASSLKEHKIPFYTEEEFQPIYNHFIITDLLEMWGVFMGLINERGAWYRVLRKCGIYISRDVLLTKKMDFESIKQLFPQHNKELLSLESKIRVFKSLNCEMGIKFLKNGVGYESYLRKKLEGRANEYEEGLRVLEWLLSKVKYYTSWKELSDYISYCRAEEIEDKMIEIKKNQKGVKLLTIHGAKGLEFDHVYILGVNEGNIPKSKQGQILTKEEIEEERRILYVGMTRAKETLELLYQIGTKESPKSPSRFINILLEK